MAKGASTFQISLKLLTTQFNKGIKDIQRQIRGLGSFVKGAFAIGSITAFGRQVVQVASEFEDSMARVRAVSNASNHELKMMTEEARKLGASTKYTASEAANALENLTRNGMSAADATKSLSGVLKLAQANAIGLAQAADIVTNTLNIFGLSADEVTRVNDVLSATCANSATDITLLAEAIVGVGPIAKIMGKSIEETAAAIGTLANKGVKGSEAGRALGAMYQRLANQSPKAAAALKQYGIEIDEAKLKSQTLSETLDMLAKSGVGDSISALSDIFGKNYAKTIASLITSQEEFNNMLEKTESAAGTTQRMFEQGVGSTKEALATLKSAYESLLESLGSKTSGVFNGVIKLLTNFINAMKHTGTAVSTVIGAIVIALNLKFAKALINVKKEAAKTNVTLRGLSASMTALKTVAQGAYAAMGGWVGILITLASVALPGIINGIHKYKEENKSLKEVEAGATSEAEKEERVLRKLYDIVNDSSKALSVRKRALQELKSTVKDYHGDLDEEGNLINNNTDAIDKYCEALKAKMVLEAREGRLKELIEQKEIAAAEALAAESQGPSFWQKVGGFFMAGAASSQEGMMGGMTAGTPKAQAQMLHDAKVDKLNNRVKELEHQIDQFTDNELKAALEAVQAITTTGGGGGGGGGKTDLQKAKDKLANAIADYYNDLSIAKAKFSDGIIKTTEMNDSILRAEQALLDTYYSTASAITDRDIKEDDLFKQVLASYRARVKAADELAQAQKEQAAAEKKFQEQALRNFEKELRAADSILDVRTEYNKEGAKNKNTNPWEGFSSNSKEYKDEEIALKLLEDELYRTQRAYDACEDEIKLLGDAMSDEAQDALAWYDELGQKLPGLIERVAAARNKLYSKRAQDEIIQLNVDKAYSYYNAIKSTTSAVSTLANSLEQLADADWNDMNFAERFSTLSNAIFGTVDAITSCIDSFKSLFRIMDDLILAQEKYAQISSATSATNVAAAEAEETANLATATSEVVKGEAAELAKDKKVAEATTTVSANTAEAVSGAAASQASIPYVGPILAAAAVAGVLALLAASIPKFASGGIIQGSSKYGDKLLARVNAGEAILNQRQQKRLLDIADGRSGAGNIVGTTIVHGKDLEIVFRNINKANSRISGSKGM